MLNPVESVRSSDYHKSRVFCRLIGNMIHRTTKTTAEQWGLAERGFASDLFCVVRCLFRCGVSLCLCCTAGEGKLAGV